MSSEKKRISDLELEDGERLTKDETRKLSAAFVAHIGKGYTTPGGKQRKKPLTDELIDMAYENPELVRLAAIRLWRMALLGQGKNAIAAMKLIFDRVEGPVVAESTREQPQTIEVSVQMPNPSRYEAPRVVSVDPPQIADDSDHEEATEEARLALRREVRRLPQPSDLLNDLEQEFHDGRQERP